MTDPSPLSRSWPDSSGATLDAPPAGRACDALESGRGSARAPNRLVGRTLGGKYRLEAVLGQGGMGGVYRARQTALDKAIAVKVMHPDLGTDPLFVARFHREARAASRLDHPHSVRIFDFGEEPDGLLYIAMELLDGTDLLTVLNDDDALPARRIVHILSQALSALSVAHEMGIIHRDLKPENIMLVRPRADDEGEHVKLCDFGIVQIAEGFDGEAIPPRAKRGKLTVAGLLLGTPDYMSPEQGRGERLDSRSDLYSMGVILYLLLAGRTPFDAATPLGILTQHQSVEPRPPSSIRADVHAGLEAVCLRAMRKRPEDRYASAREMRAALRAALEEAPSSAPATRAADPLRLDPTAPTGVLAAVPMKGLEGAPRADAIRTDASAPGRLRWSNVLLLTLGAAALGAAAFHATRIRAAPASVPAGAPIVHRTAEDSVSARAEEEPPAVPLRAAPSEFAATPRGSAEAMAPPRATPRRPNLARSTPMVPTLVSTATPPRAMDAPGQPIAWTEDPGHPAPELRATATPLATPPPSTEPLPAMLPAPAAPPFDPSRARVSAAEPVGVMGGARPSEVDAIVRSALGRITACYRASATPSTPEGSFTLLLVTDDEGNVDQGQLDGPLASPVKECITKATRGRVHADTGRVSAKVALSFRLH